MPRKRNLFQLGYEEREFLNIPHQLPEITKGEIIATITYDFENQKEVVTPLENAICSGCKEESNYFRCDYGAGLNDR